LFSLSKQLHFQKLIFLSHDVFLLNDSVKDFLLPESASLSRHSVSNFLNCNFSLFFCHIGKVHFLQFFFDMQLVVEIVLFVPPLFFNFEILGRLEKGHLNIGKVQIKLLRDFQIWQNVGGPDRFDVKHRLESIRGVLLPTVFRAVQDFKNSVHYKFIISQIDYRFFKLIHFSNEGKNR
jgi:hypothetical protein